MMKPDKGTILVNGEPVQYGNFPTNSYIGYLPDVPEFYNFMTPMEYLIFCGDIVGMEKKAYSQERRYCFLSSVWLMSVTESKGFHVE